MGILTENYQIIKELGRGGMGAVYLAKDKRLDRRVAIKMLQLNPNFSLEQKSEIIARFEKEAKAVAKLTHPNIVGIHDVGEDSEQHYMVMEFLEGKSIGSTIDDEGKLPIQQCIEISIQMCKALDYVHGNSIVHRDIKPDNIIISTQNIAKLTDFGIAQAETDQLRLTQDGAILGSIMYISPEQLRNSKDVDNRADIYSFGVTLYQMLTGELPFKGETVGEVVTKVLGDQPELPRKLNPDIPHELEAIVMRAMNKDRNKRYTSMGEMERDLQNLLATRSFRNTANLNTRSTTGNIGSATLNKTGTNNLSTNRPSTSNLSTSGSSVKVIEKADTSIKLLRTIGKLILSIGIVYLCFGLFIGMVKPGIAEEVISKANFESAMIQGPYSQYLVESKASVWAVLYSLILVTLFLMFSAYAFPIDSKGIHRNFSITSEFLPALSVLILTTIVSFAFIAKTDTISDYSKAFNKDSNSKINNFEALIGKKGKLDYSEIINYKKEYRDILFKESKTFRVYPPKEEQLRTQVLEGDSIKVNYIPLEKKDDQGHILIRDIMDTFVIPDPDKIMYSSRLDRLASLVSDGYVTSIPQTAGSDIKKDPNSSRVINVTFLWGEGNEMILTPGKVTLKEGRNEYEYPKATSKVSTIKIENITDQEIFILFYSVKNDKLEKSIVVNSGKSENFSFNEGSGFKTIVLFSEKTALPMYLQEYYGNGDIIKVDKIYYETPDYYSLNIKKFPEGESIKTTKFELLFGNELFNTNDADIKAFKLKAFKN